MHDNPGINHIPKLKWTKYYRDLEDDKIIQKGLLKALYVFFY